VNSKACSLLHAFLFANVIAISGCSVNGSILTPATSDTAAPLPPSTIQLDNSVPDGTQTPAITFPSSPDSDVVRYEAQVINADGDVIVEDWQAVNSGESLDNLSLQTDQIYYLNVRAVDQAGNSSQEVEGPRWIPGSQGCVSDKITNSPYASGSGTMASPYLICTKTQFLALSSRSQDFRSHFKLQANLNLSGQIFDGIGSLAAPFQGVLDGAQFSISNVTINRVSGNNVGLFNVTKNAWIRNLTLMNPNYTATASAKTGGLIGSCESTQIRNVNVTNLSLNSFDETGGLIGVGSFCDVLNSTLSGTIVSTGEVVGGVVGGAEKGKYYNITSTLDINSPTAIGVGGIFGGDYWSSPHFQNVQIEGDITGQQYVGGFNGYNYDGASIYRSSYKGTITGQNSVGGASGVNWDSPYSVYSSYIDATINGNTMVGGFSGQHGYRTNFYDSYVKATINGTGAAQADFGGFFGKAEYYGDIYRSYNNVTINSTASTAGGAIGHIDYWSPSYDIRDSFVVANVSGSSASPRTSLFIGLNTNVAVPASNTSYWSGGSCNNAGGGGCNTSYGGTPVANFADFYSPSQASMSTWNFTSLWVQNAGSFPTHNWNRYHTPSVTASCDTVASVGIGYSCALSITDLDLNESQMVSFQDDHTCLWMYNYDNRIAGNPISEDVGSCKVSYVITDGVRSSAIQTFNVIVHKGVAISPAASSNGYYSYNFQNVTGGEKQVTFTLTNQESEAITGLTFGGLPSTHFVFGGNIAFPGAGGSCTNTLAAGASCTVVISFDPSTSGQYFHDVYLQFTNSTGPVSQRYQLYGWGL
jgi:hypothetical protein